MSWYYANEGKQIGPVDDREWARLRERGVLRPDTMVWQNGMAEWVPFASLEPAAAPTATAVPNSRDVAASVQGAATCAECGRVFPESELVAIGGHQVCALCKPVAVQKLTEGSLTTTDAVYAGFWIRVGAKLIDWIILAVAGQIIQLVFGLVAGSADPGVTTAVALGGSALSLLLQGGYSIYFLGRYGATPGKMACGLRVVMADGGALSYGRATGRFFAEILSSIIFCIGYLMVAFDDQKRALHDRICDTRVVRK